jgi:hypothetical protein
VEDRERRSSAAKSDEPVEEGANEDVELHRRSSLQENTEPPAEGESDDDVELHRRKGGVNPL